ncbi:uncharacterized protein LOC125179408 [Hyalella azteca]|uniref:Hexosyltransferase n=1 Tax=Hyalella azteca TaxID=294128 RepID=A0A979FXE0_HYAAZ|nr:uncharacterized protein LOC125179408 [Hyalella azteca]
MAAPYRLQLGVGVESLVTCKDQQGRVRDVVLQEKLGPTQRGDDVQDVVDQTPIVIALTIENRLDKFASFLQRLQRLMANRDENITLTTVLYVGEELEILKLRDILQKAQLETPHLILELITIQGNKVEKLSRNFIFDSPTTKLEEAKD